VLRLVRLVERRAELRLAFGAARAALAANAEELASILLIHYENERIV